MVDLDGGHHEAVALEHDATAPLRRLARLERRDGPRLHLACRERHQALAVVVVGVAIGAVGRVGGVEAADHLLDAVRAEDLQRIAAALRPALHVELAELADVVGVEVREQHRADARDGQAPTVEVLRGLRADVDQHPLAARDDDRAGLGGGAVGHGTRGAAEQHAQRVVRCGHLAAARDRRVRRAGDHGVLHRG